jgi:hypothetical protein
MSEIERRRQKQVDPYELPLATSWREAMVEQSLEFRTGSRVRGNAKLSVQTARYANELLDEVSDLGQLGNMIVQRFVFRSMEAIDGYMDQ